MVTVFDATSEFSEGDGTEYARLGPFVLIPARSLLQRLSESRYRNSTPRPINRGTENLYQRSLETLEPAPHFSDDSDLMCNCPLRFQ